MKRVKYTAIAVLILMSLFHFADLTSLSVFASDLPVIEETEPENAIRGEVLIQTLIYEDLSYPIQLDFFPMFEGGVHRTFILNEENGFKLIERLMIGEYYVAAGICINEETKDLNVRATATPKIVIEENAESLPIVVVLEGTDYFVQSYGWLTSYEDDAEGYLSGSITAEQANEYFEKTITSQRYVPMDGETYETIETYEKEAIEFMAEEENDSFSFIKYTKFIVFGIMIAVSLILYAKFRKK